MSLHCADKGVFPGSTHVGPQLRRREEPLLHMNDHSVVLVVTANASRCYSHALLVLCVRFLQDECTFKNDKAPDHTCVHTCVAHQQKYSKSTDIVISEAFRLLQEKENKRVRKYV